MKSGTVRGGRSPPLDSATTSDLEITEEQEVWLKWMIQNEIEHVRLE